MIDEAGYSQFRWLEEFLEGVDEVGKFGVAFGEVVAIGVVELSSEIADAAVAVPDRCAQGFDERFSVGCPLAPRSVLLIEIVLCLDGLALP